MREPASRARPGNPQGVCVGGPGPELVLGWGRSRAAREGAQVWSLCLVLLPGGLLSSLALMWRREGLPAFPGQQGQVPALGGVEVEMGSRGSQRWPRVVCVCVGGNRPLRRGLDGHGVGTPGRGPRRRGNPAWKVTLVGALRGWLCGSTRSPARPRLCKRPSTGGSLQHLGSRGPCSLVGPRPGRLWPWRLAGCTLLDSALRQR